MIEQPIDFSALSLNDLKVMVYDLSQELGLKQQRLQSANAEIFKRETAVPAMKLSVVEKAKEEVAGGDKAA